MWKFNEIELKQIIIKMSYFYAAHISFPAHIFFPEFPEFRLASSTSHRCIYVRDNIEGKKCMQI